MKVYLVFQGCYSDRFCKAVFDNKETAEKYAEMLDNEDCSSVEEFEVNEIKLSDFELVTYYIATVYLDNSFYLKGSIHENSYKRIKNKNEKIEKCSIYKGYRGQISITSTVSKEHAKKVAIEQYQIYTQNQLENPPLNNNEDDF